MGRQEKFNLIKDFVRGGQRGSRPPEAGVVSLSLEFCKDAQVGENGDPVDPCTDPGGAEEP